MAVTINIKNVEWSNNPVTVSQATLLKISVSKITDDILRCSSDVSCGECNCGEQNLNENILEP